MRWTMGRRSDNVEDRRGSGPGMPLVAGGGIGSIILDAKGDVSFLTALRQWVPLDKLKVFDLSSADV